MDGPPQFALAARRANSTEPTTVEQTAWLAYVRGVAAQSDVAVFDAEQLASLALEAPRLTQAGPGDLRLLPGRFAACGVVLVSAAGLQGGKLDGAVTFPPDGRPVIALTTRGARFDGVLFTLLHECAHLTLGHITLDGYEISSTSTQAILEAALRYRVHPSVVIGRVQRDTGDWRRYRTKIPKARPFLAEAGLMS